MIKEAYCSYGIYKLLKEKGFDEPIRCWYDDEQDFHEKGVRMSNTDCLPPTIMCPTHQMAMRWLREVHNIDIIIFHEKLPNDCYWARIERDLSTEFEQEPEYNSYEDAVEAALKYCLENLI